MTEILGEGTGSGFDLNSAVEQLAPSIPGTQQQQQQDSQQQSSQGNPAWKELLDIMPTQLHTQIQPILAKWEQGTQQRFQQHAEQMKQYEPYKNLIDNQVPMDYIEQALSVAQLIDENPQGFMQQLQSIFGEQNQQLEQGQQNGQQQQYDYGDQEGTFEQQQWDISQDPRFQELQQHQDLLANYIAQQMTQEQQTQEDAELDTMLNDLREQYGDYDERYVVTMAASGMHPEEAVKSYMEMVNGIRSAPRPDAGLPRIVSPSNGMPSEQIDVANLSDGDRKKLVQNILAQASQNRG
jgi:hypothetical protein